MPTTIDLGVELEPPAENQGLRDPFLRLREVLQIKRNHFPGEPGQFVRLRQACTESDTCWFIGKNDIEQFRVRRYLGCTTYSAIQNGYREWRKFHKSHNTAFKASDIFADVKVLIADEGEPLRATLSRRAVYPQRAKILTVREGEARIWAYVAVAVLNSAIGQAYYRAYMEKRSSLRRGRDGVHKQAILDLPLVARSYDSDAVERVADSAHQLLLIGDAQTDLNRHFTEQAIDARIRLLWNVVRGLRLSESDEEILLESVRQQNWIDAPIPNSLLGRSLLHKRIDVRLDAPAVISKRDHARYAHWRSKVNESLLDTVGTEWLWAPAAHAKKGLRKHNTDNSKGLPYNPQQETAEMNSPELAIVKDPRRCGGHPTVGTTRLTVHNIVSQVQMFHGDISRVLEEFPHWNREQIDAGLRYYAKHRSEIDAILLSRRQAYERELANASNGGAT